MNKMGKKWPLVLASLLLFFSNTALFSAERPAPSAPPAPTQGRDPRAPRPEKPGNPDMPPPRPGPHPPKDSVMNYRGTRMLAENEIFAVKKARCCKLNETCAEIEVSFNQSINPRSIKPCCIMIDNLELPDETKFSFNKKGDTIRFTVPLDWTIKKLNVKGLRSYTGTLIMPAEIVIAMDVE